MATFRFEVNSKPTKNKTYWIYMRVTTDGKRKMIKTSVEIKRKSDFNTKAKQEGWVRPSDPNHKVCNAALAAELERAKAIYRDAVNSGGATSERVVAEIKAGERTSSFLQYAKERTQQIYDAGGFRNWKKYNGFINKLEGFLSNNGKARDLTFAELTPGLLSKFETYLHTLSNERDPERKLHPNTIKVIFTIFKTIVKRAVEVDGYIKPEKNSFLAYNYRGIITVKEKLNRDEIALIESLELPEGSNLWHSRNCFLFSFYCAGIRAGDLLQLRWLNITSDGRLHYQMDKNHKVRDLVLVPQAKAILSYYQSDEAKPTEYIFPFLDASKPYAKAVTPEEKDTMTPGSREALYNQISTKNALVNKYLKKLADLAGIEKKVSFHISRHSFAKVAKQHGTDNAKLKDLMAHSSLKQTETYMGNFDTSETDEALEAIFVKPQHDPKAELMSVLEAMTPEQITALLSHVKK